MNRPVKVPNKMLDKLLVDIDPQTLYLGHKVRLIEEFNHAVEKGASNPYLVSLLRTTHQEIKEANHNLGLLPEDGFNQLNMRWKERYE